MSKLDTKSLASEVASPHFWRRQTAQRLLVERAEERRALLGTKAFTAPKPSDARRSDESAAPVLRALLADQNSVPSTLITALRTLDGLNALTPAGVQPFIGHADVGVRVHALQLADRWFAKDEGRAVLDTTIAAAASETSPRVPIQVALSLGESRDPRAFAMLARYAREKLTVRWMDVAVLSLLHGRAGEMLDELLREPGGSGAWLPSLAQSIAAHRNETELSRAINLAATVKPELRSGKSARATSDRRSAAFTPLHPAPGFGRS